MNKTFKEGIKMKHVYLVVYVGEIYGSYYKAHDIQYKVFSSKRKAKKYINSKIKSFSNKRVCSNKEQEKRKYLIFKKVIDNEN